MPYLLLLVSSIATTPHLSSLIASSRCRDAQFIQTSLRREEAQRCFEAETRRCVVAMSRRPPLARLAARGSVDRLSHPYHRRSLARSPTPAPPPLLTRSRLAPAATARGWGHGSPPSLPSLTSFARSAYACGPSVRSPPLPSRDPPVT